MASFITRSLRLFFVGQFLAFLSTPGIAMLFAHHSGSGMLASEKRSRTPFPSLRTTNLHDFPDRFEAWFRDNFGFRDLLIRWHNRIEVRYLRQSPVPNVIIGNHGMLFYAGHGDGIDIRDFSGRLPLADTELRTIRKRTLARRTQYAAAGARYLVVIVPNKQTLYPERIPTRYGPHAPGQLDQLLGALAGTDVTVLDLRPILAAHRDEPIYYDTDTHWNANGAFYGAQAIIAALGLPPLSRDEFTITRVPRRGGDLADMLAMTDDFDDVDFGYLPHNAYELTYGPFHQVYERHDGQRPRALVLGDSFSQALAPALAPCFSHLHSYNAAHIGFDDGLLMKERPDVVILEAVERYAGGSLQR